MTALILGESIIQVILQLVINRYRDVFSVLLLPVCEVFLFLPVLVLYIDPAAISTVKPVFIQLFKPCLPDPALAGITLIRICLQVLSCDRLHIAHQQPRFFSQWIYSVFSICNHNSRYGQ